MAEKKLIKLFKESAERLAKKSKNSSTAIHTMGGLGEIDHNKICPFRSVPFEDCPLCILDSLDKL
jgi:hypothetical protein